ncbi:Holliday junction branch migration protein RuvA [Spirobacillus cienkowskii]|uniref:Holliday junction branch migration protein RuvA n=1 Tax=Spirobacillus cienkowskii TaxID=495820 RepID=UPI0030D297E4
MIGFLRGILIEKSPEKIIIDTSGVGYEIEVPATTLCQLPSLQQETQIHILTHVREDSIRLFGFATSFDKKVFIELINVSGVGPKVALALLSTTDGSNLCEIIVSGQVAKLTAIPGVGVKTAERLILELKTKMQKLLARRNEELDLNGQLFNQDTSLLHDVKIQKISQNVHKKLIQKQLIEDLKSALSNLGYKDKQFSDVLHSFERRMNDGETITIEIGLKEALTKLTERIIQHMN